MTSRLTSPGLASGVIFPLHGIGFEITGHHIPSSSLAVQNDLGLKNPTRSP